MWNPEFRAQQAVGKAMAPGFEGDLKLHDPAHTVPTSWSEDVEILCNKPSPSHQDLVVSLPFPVDWVVKMALF